MNSTQNPPQQLSTAPSKPRGIRALQGLEPVTGLWGYRMGQVLAVVFLFGVVPTALAVGLGWVEPERVQQLVPTLRRLATFLWTVSLFSLVFSLFGLSEYGPKRRTLYGLAINAILTLGPVLMALLLR